MSLFDVKTKQVIFIMTPSGPEIISHDYRTNHTAKRLVKAARRHIDILEDLEGPGLKLKMTVETSLIDPALHFSLDLCD